MQRIPFDVDVYAERVRSNPCFICAVVAEPGSDGWHEVVAETEDNIAFLSKYPTLLGHVLVAPKTHREHVVGDFSESAYLELMTLVYRVAKAVEATVEVERTYLLSLGSQQGNSHVHWHISPLPPGVPYHEQQFHALMAENGVLPWTQEQAGVLARRLRAVLADQLRKSW
ncbi:HIT family protein [Nocardia blacklockiae]|uniref:HIT family protein n=1 Tax=Nocardia blacklockiae TaxID=480036 RepID=UPI0018961AC1|nr:HIT family protein [Nocardia blacklockiae]MBF6173736.1 HIT family protein [Nocardia blacklockiae]